MRFCTAGRICFVIRIAQIPAYGFALETGWPFRWSPFRTIAGGGQVAMAVAWPRSRSRMSSPPVSGGRPLTFGGLMQSEAVDPCELVKA